LGGIVIGYVYMKSDWRLSSFFRLSRYLGYLRDLRYRRRMKVINKQREREQKLLERVDQILDKINQIGFDNLTKEEKKTLEEASQFLSQQSERK
jgi:PP-loop superfamily ATP-utilizing enzyme